MTITVAFISQKGGVGKTTLAIALATLAAENGWTAKIADLDSGQTSSVLTHTLRLKATKEAQDREAQKKKPKPLPAKPNFEVQAFDRASDALKHKANFDLYVLDGPAKTSAASLEIARAADLVIQPTSPAMVDLVPAVAEFLGMERAGICPSKLILALNKVKTSTQEAEARDFLARKAPQFRVWGQALRDQAGYVAAMNRGDAITEVPAAKLKVEAVAAIESLMAIVSAQMSQGEAAQ